MGALVYLLREIIPNPQGVLIFVATRHHAEYLVVGFCSIAGIWIATCLVFLFDNECFGKSILQVFFNI